MKHVEINNQLLMMDKYNLSAEEVLLIDLLFLASIEEGHDEYLIKYFNINCPKSNLRDLLLSLQDKGIITKQYKVPNKGQKFDPESVEFNKNFLHNYRKFSGDLGVEFYDTYPSIAWINGIDAPLKNFAKKFNSEEEFYYCYGKAIGWNLEKHKKVLDLINWAKDTKCNLLNMNIADFVISKMWNSISELKETDGSLSYNTTTYI